MSALQITQGGKPKPPRVIAHGFGGIGKTTFFSKFPNPIIIPTEDGASGLKVDQFPLQTTWEGVLECVKHLGTTDHNYKTVVLDSLDVTEKLLHKFVCDKFYEGNFEAKKGGKSFMSFHAGYKTSAAEFKQLTDYLDRLREKGMIIGIIAHTGILTEKNPLGNDYGKYAAKLHRDSWNLWYDWADIVGFATRDITVIGTESVNDKGKARYSSKARYLVFEGDGGVDAKCRAGYELPARIPLDAEEFFRHIGRDDSGATKDLQEHFDSLIGEVDAETADKAKAYIGSKPGKDKLKTAINRLLNVLEYESEKKNVESI